MESEGGKLLADDLAVIVDAGARKIEYRWGPADLREVGTHKGEFEFLFTDGRIRRWPKNGYISIEVQDDLGIGTPSYYRNEIAATNPGPRLWLKMQDLTGSVLVNSGSSGSTNDGVLNNPGGLIQRGQPGLLPNAPLDRAVRYLGTDSSGANSVAVPTATEFRTPPLTLMALAELERLPSSQGFVHPIFLYEAGAGPAPAYSFSVGVAPGFEDRPFLTVFRNSDGAKFNVTSAKKIEVGLPWHQTGVIT